MLLGVGIAAFALLSIGIDWGLPISLAVTGGVRVLDGDLPYRDFWTLYAPGSAVANAAVLGAFGRDYAASSQVAVALAAGAVAAFVALLRRLHVSRPLALALGAWFGAAIWAPAPDIDTYAVPRLLLLLGWERTVRYLQTGRRAPLVAAGLGFGVAAWFKHDVGAYAALGTGAGLLLAWWVAGERRPSTWEAPLRAALRVGLASAAAVAPVAVTLAWIAPAQAWDALVVFPATEFSVVRSEQYAPWVPDLAPLLSWLREPANLERGWRAAGGLGWWAQDVAPQVLVPLCGCVLLALRRRATPQELGALSLLLASVPLFWFAAHVQHNTHIYSMAMLCVPAAVLTWRLAAGLAGSRTRRGVRAAVAVVGAVYAVGMLVPSGLGFGRTLIEGGGKRAIGLPGMADARVSEGDYRTYRGIADFVRRNVPEHEPIYVGLRRHDSIVVSAPALYLVAGRRPATRYHELHPGIADRADVQEEIIRELELRGVTCVIQYNFGWADARMDRILAKRRLELPELGATRLDAWLREHFAPVARFGEFSLLWRKDAPPPRARSAPQQ